MPKRPTETLQDFRDGTINLIISTDALDEGIDVALCNTIICFDRPDNLRSYIQKRGRARQKRSTFIMMAPDTLSPEDVQFYKHVEKRINALLDDETRHYLDAQSKEVAEEDVEFVLTSRHK